VNRVNQDICKDKKKTKNERQKKDQPLFFKI